MRHNKVQQNARVWQAIAALATYAFTFLLPFSVFWQIGSPLVANVLPMYVSRGGYLSDLAIFVLLALSLVNMQLHNLGPKTLTLPLMLLILLSLLTSFSAISVGLALYTSMRWVLAAFVYIWFLQDVIPLSRIAKVFLFGLSIQAIVGLGQVIGQAPLGLPGELALPAAQSGSAILEVAGVRWLRAYGLTFHPNVFGGYMLVGLLLGLPMIHKRRYMLLIWWLLFLGLFLSFSRGAWAAAMFAIPLAVAMLARRYPERHRSLYITLAGAGLILMASVLAWNGQLATRLRPLALLVSPPAEVSIGGEPSVAPTEHFSVAERLVLTRTALESIAARPWQGVGAGNFPLLVLVTNTELRPQPVHNVPALLAAEIGLFGGILWLFIWVAGLALLGRGWATAGIWRVSLLCTWLAVGILALFDSYPWALNSGRLLTVMVLGLAGRSLSAGQTNAEPADVKR